MTQCARMVNCPVMTKITIEPAKQDIERLGVSVKTAAKMLDVSERTMWTLAKEQKIRTSRIGTRVIFSVESLREFVDGKQNVSTVTTGHSDKNIVE